MATTTKTVAHPIAILHLPAAKTPALITYAQGIVKAMTGNPAFPNPTPPLTAITAAINDLQVAELAAQARTKGAVTTRNEKRAALVTQLKQLQGCIQAAADANVENGASIIESAGVAVRKTVTRGPRVFAAKVGTITGTAKLVAPAAARRSCYEWQYSADGGKTWAPSVVTLQAKTTILGLTAGATVLFRYRPVLKTGEENWSQTVALVVQ
jgi:hypothetical protein